MPDVLIFVDNMRLGGFQRLALDQAYALSDRGYNVKLNVLSPSTEWTLVDLESSLIDSKNISVEQFPMSRISLGRRTYSSIKDLSSPLIISHSLRSTFTLRIVRVLFRKHYTINTTIHQLPGLTDIRQRLKRFIYSQFSDRLYCFSSGVQQSWDKQFKLLNTDILKRFSKEISVLRNGVYLNRLPVDVDHSSIDRRPRIVFLGRLAFWKGMSTLETLSKSESLGDFDFMFMVPNIDNSSLDAISSSLGNRAIVISGQTISSYIPMRGDVHVYPANYGGGVSIVESISLNCLEMASLGVPSLVSKSGMGTWPELNNSKLFAEVVWEETVEVEYQILKIHQVSISSLEIEKVRELVSIERQIEVLINNF
jgi:glycosyltransferase involved in cell wall biosynthesis